MISAIEKELYLQAKKAAMMSYSPYSHFRVGAAAKTISGEIFIGANVENVSYGLTICAERVAICNALMAGHRKLEYIAIYGGKGEISPCGACRQFIVEFGNSIKVIYSKKGKLIVAPIGKLMPDLFFIAKHTTS
jgi:cytidine deaminase